MLKSENKSSSQTLDEGKTLGEVKPPASPKLIIPSILILCSQCPHHKEKSLFCSKGFLQDQAFCKNFNSYKIKFFVRAWDKESKKTKETFLMSKCVNSAMLVKLYTMIRLSDVRESVYRVNRKEKEKLDTMLSNP